MTKTVATWIALALFALSTHAWGAPTASEIAVARQLFEQGRRHQEHNRWALAAGKYRNAVAIKDTPGLRYRLAYCEERQGHLVEANLEYQRAAELLELGVVAHDVAELLPEALARVQRRTPRVVVVLSNEVERASLKIDGHAVASHLLGQSIPLNPGKHRLALTAPAHQSFTRTLTLAEGEQQRIEVVLEPLNPLNPLKPLKPPEPPNEAPASNLSSTKAKATVLASEAAIVVAGVSVGLVSRRRKASAEARIETIDAAMQTSYELDEHSCNRPTGQLSARCQKLQSALDDRSQANGIATGAFVVAGVGAVAALVTYVAWPSEGPHLASWLTPKFTGLTMAGQF